MYQPQRLCLSKTLLAMARVSLSHHETVPVPPTRVGEPRTVQPSCWRPRTPPVLPPPPFPCRPRRKTRPVPSGVAASCTVAPAPVVAAEARDGCLGGMRGRVLACGSGAGRCWCRCCRRRRDLRWQRTRGWGRHARVSFFVVVLARDPLALLVSPAASAHPGGRFPL